MTVDPAVLALAINNAGDDALGYAGIFSTEPVFTVPEGGADPAAPVDATAADPVAAAAAPVDVTAADPAAAAAPVDVTVADPAAAPVADPAAAPVDVTVADPAAAAPVADPAAAAAPVADPAAADPALTAVRAVVEAESMEVPA